MDIIQYILVAVFIVATIVGYFVINKVPSLLHTPLMSGMNALSGVTIIGAIAIIAIEKGHLALGYIFGSLAVILAMVNVVGGFAVTHRMLRMFTKKRVKKDD